MRGQPGSPRPAEETSEPSVAPSRRSPSDAAPPPRPLPSTTGAISSPLPPAATATGGPPLVAPATTVAPATNVAPASTVAPDEAGLDRGATGPQLRRFIKSRAYVPMHELRRRFGINGQDDDVTPVDVDRHRIFVGLPPREGELLGELLRAGDIGYELSLDPISPIVVGVYPMRPVTRG